MTIEVRHPVSGKAVYSFAVSRKVEPRPPWRDIGVQIYAKEGSAYGYKEWKEIDPGGAKYLLQNFHEEGYRFYLVKTVFDPRHNEYVLDEKELSFEEVLKMFKIYKEQEGGKMNESYGYTTLSIKVDTAMELRKLQNEMNAKSRDEVVKKLIECWRAHCAEREP